MRTFLIIYISNNNVGDIQVRIRSIGEAFFFHQNNCLVSVEDDNLTAQNIYNRLENETQLTGVFVTEINTRVARGYWGTMNRDFWNWLQTHQTDANNSL